MERDGAGGGGMIDHRPHRNTPAAQLENELGQLHDRLQFLQAQLDRLTPDAPGRRKLAADIESVKERRQSIFAELRNRRKWR